MCLQYLLLGELNIDVFVIFVCRYSREESFTAINADIRLHHNLFESLDSYVKGDLLEGGNAYHCEKCNKKVSFYYTSKIK